MLTQKTFSDSLNKINPSQVVAKRIFELSIDLIAQT